MGATHKATLAIPGPVLAELESHGIDLSTVLDRVEGLLHAQVTSSHAFVDRAANYLIDAGGKRFRPMLVALAAHLGDPARRGVAEAAVIVELVHLATLYHDDVIDEADARRGTPSANARWDNTVATLTGDYLFARASELSADLGVEVTRIMAQTLAKLCEGEILEVQGSTGALPDDVPRIEPSREHYLKVLAGKTASLIATSCRYGALMGGCDRETVETITTYGWNVGMAFQLSDDLLDIASSEDQSGKIPGTDLREGVMTLPVLLAVEAEPDGEIARLMAGERSEADVARLLELLRDSVWMDQARDAAISYVETASLLLDELEDDRAAVKALRRLAEYAVDRVG